MTSITFKEFAQMVHDLRVLQNRARSIPREDRKSKQYWMRRVGTKAREIDAWVEKILGGQSELFHVWEPIVDEVMDFKDDEEIPF